MKKTVKALSFLIALVLAFLPVFILGVPTAGAAGNNKNWVSAWATSPVNGSLTVSAFHLQDIIPAKTTLRTELTVTTGGTKLRFRFSNQYGESAVTVSQASVARTANNGATSIIDDTQTPILFGGVSKGIIPAGGELWSDEVNFVTSPMEKLSVSLFFDNLTYITTTGLSNGSTYMGTRNLIASNTPSKINYVSLSGANEITLSSGSITYHTIPFLCDIETLSNKDSAGTAVFIGDSTLVNDTWLYYAQKLNASGINNLGIINEAIVGNKLLSDGTGIIGNFYGKALLDRFADDVLSKPHVRYAFVKIGLNDILHQYAKSMASSVPKYTPEQIIAGYRQLILMAHKNNVKVYFFTKSAWKGYSRSFLGQKDDLVWNREAQEMCDKLDEWIRTNKEADGVIDCAPLADPQNPTALRSAFTPDGAHLTALGSIALADLIPLEYVGGNSKTAKTSAQLNNVSPYTAQSEPATEKNTNNKNNNTKTEATTKNNAQQPATQAQQPVVPATEAPTQAPITEAPVTEETTTEALIPAAPVTEEPSTLPYTEPTTVIAVPGSVTPTTPKAPSKKASAKDIAYQPQTVDVDQIGSGTGVLYVFALFSSVIVAGVIVFLTIGRRKENIYG